MRHAQSILTAAVLVSMVGCATTPQREDKPEVAKAGQPPSPEPKAAAAGSACGALASPVATGIADSDGKVLYLRAEGGVEAVDAQTGATLWRTTNVERAVAVGHGQVAGVSRSAQASDAVQLSYLSSATGALISNGPELSLAGVRAEGAEIRGAFCNPQEVELAWSGLTGSGTARVDLSRRLVVSGPNPGGGASVGWADPSKVGALELRAEDGVLRAFGEDGAVRWERPLAPRRLSSRP